MISVVEATRSGIFDKCRASGWRLVMVEESTGKDR